MELFFYDYHDEMFSDIRDYIVDNAEPEKLRESFEKNGGDQIYEFYSDHMWCEDSITGNGSGSYTFDRELAKKYVICNPALLKEALEAFCVDRETIATKFLEEDWEYFDVTIRCYLLSDVLYEVINTMRQDYENE